MDNVQAISSATCLTGAERVFAGLELNGLGLSDPLAAWRAFDQMREAAFDAQVEFSKAFLQIDGPERDAALVNAREHCRTIANRLRELSRLGVKP